MLRTIATALQIFRFEQCDCVIKIQSTHRQRSMINEKQNRESIARREFAASNKNDMKKFDFTDIDLNQSNRKMKINEKNNVFFENLENVKRIISKIFNEYKA